MRYSNKLNLQEFFAALSDEIYCVVKFSDNFPNYPAYTDVDIFCFDINKISNKILAVGNNYVENNKCAIKITNLSKDQVHIDFHFNGSKKLDFRFDLYQALPAFKRINIKQGFYSTIIENRLLNDKNVYVPDKIDDLILRYAEFIEWYDIRADKLKHVEYIKEKASDAEQKIMLDKLHYYTALPGISTQSTTKKTDKRNAESKASSGFICNSIKLVSRIIRAARLI